MDSCLDPGATLKGSSAWYSRLPYEPIGRGSPLSPPPPSLCLTVGSPFSSMCHVSTVNAQLRFRIMGHFSKISLLIRFGTMEKKIREEEKSSSTVGLFEVICLCFIKLCIV